MSSLPCGSMPYRSIRRPTGRAGRTPPARCCRADSHRKDRTPRSLRRNNRHRNRTPRNSTHSGRCSCPTPRARELSTREDRDRRSTWRFGTRRRCRRRRFPRDWGSEDSTTDHRGEHRCLRVLPPLPCMSWDAQWTTRRSTPPPDRPCTSGCTLRAHSPSDSCTRCIGAYDRAASKSTGRDPCGPTGNAAP